MSARASSRQVSDVTRIRRSLRIHSEDGFTLVEIMTVVMILSILVLIAIPRYINSRDTAVAAVLKVNQRSIETKVDALIYEGYNALYKKNGAGSPDTYLSTKLETDLELDLGGGEYSTKESFKNPVSGLSNVLNWNTVNISGNYTPPAVFITNGTTYRYESIAANPTRLAGTVIVQFNTTKNTIDFFYMDRYGVKSSTMTRRVLPDGMSVK